MGSERGGGAGYNLGDTTAVPPGTCLTHGYHGGAMCPECNSGTSVDPLRRAPQVQVQRAQTLLEINWEQKFHYAMSGLSWAVGRLGDEAGHAGKVFEHLTNPLRMVAPPEADD